MDLLIKDMKMPIFEHQSWDIRKDTDGKWYIIDTNAETSDDVWHEIVPVPPHGRLIDADVIREDWLENGKNEYVYDTNAFLSSIDDAPTIIQADKNTNIQEEFLQNWHEEGDE